MSEAKQIEVAGVVAEEFGLGGYIRHDPIDGNRRDIVSLTTDRGKYVLKPAGNPAALQLYSDVERRLNATGVRQAQLFRKSNGSLTSSHGYAVYEWMEGVPSTRLTIGQLESTMAYLAEYNTALAEIPIPASMIALDDPWKQAASPKFIINELPSRFGSLDLNAVTRDTAEQCIEFLSSNRQVLDDLSMQLIHSDIGPGNILFVGDEVISIIDFTPQSAPELYSLCQFFYWQFLWFNGFKLDVDRVCLSLKLYGAERPELVVDESIVRVLFVLAAGFRLFGPLLAMAEGLSSYSQDAIEQRANLLSRILKDNLLGAGTV